ncbi:MAG: hypothetical protein M8353_05830 [ANME-2 cluster archaeon]|nr:hypothetical protein [ANME-2 cluster archaeon]
MRNNNIVILGPWLFVIAVWIGIIWIGQEMEFFGIIILFMLALVGSVILAALIHGKEYCEAPEFEWMKSWKVYIPNSMFLQKTWEKSRRRLKSKTGVY